MKKPNANSWNMSHGKTAEFVVAHAKWQQSRGRKPSLIYKGIKNPKQALSRALEVLQEHEPLAGENISYTADCMVKIVTLTGNKCMSYFNDVCLIANPGFTTEQIIELYNKAMEVRRQEYRNSPAARLAAQRVEECKNQARAEVKKAMIDLPDLDYSDFLSVIRWFERIRDPSDTIGVDIDSSYIVEEFKNHHFESGVNCGEDFDGDNEENFARWLIGQALDSLKSFGSIHQVFDMFAKDYREKFTEV